MALEEGGSMVDDELDARIVFLREEAAPWLKRGP